MTRNETIASITLTALGCLTLICCVFLFTSCEKHRHEWNSSKGIKSGSLLETPAESSQVNHGP